MRALKPDPDGWRVIAEQRSASGDATAVVVGDSWVDGVAAAAAGVPFVAYRAEAGGPRALAGEPGGRADRPRPRCPAWLATHRVDAGNRSASERGTFEPARASRAGRGRAAAGGAAGRPHAAAHARRGRRPGAPARARAACCARRIESGELHSMILWGPPGSGKTTLASLMAQVAGARFVAFSAVLSGVKEIRQVVAEAEPSAGAARPAHDPLRRRDPPLQPRPAGRVPAPRREGHDRPDRRHHREPVVRGQLGAALALPRVRAARARRGRSCVAILRRALADRERGLGALRPSR